MKDTTNGMLPESGYKRVLVICVYVAIIFAIVYITVCYLIKLILPFLLAWLVAMMIYPLIVTLNRRTRLPKKLLSLIFILGGITAVGGIVYYIVRRMFEESRRLIILASENADVILDRIFVFFDRVTARIPIAGVFDDAETLMNAVSDIVKSALATLSAKIPEWITMVIGILPGVLFFTLILVMASFYICVDYERVNRFILAQLPEKTVGFLKKLKGEFSKTSLKYLRAYLLMMMITFSELTAGFLLLKIDYAFTIALLAAIVDILPVLGVGSVLIPWSLVLLIGGNYYTGFGLLIMFAAISVVRQIIEPKIVGDSIGLYPLATLVSMYAGYRLFGFVGIIIMPITIILLKNLNDSGAIHLWNNEPKPK